MSCSQSWKGVSLSHIFPLKANFGEARLTFGKTDFKLNSLTEGYS